MADFGAKVRFLVEDIAPTTATLVYSMNGNGRFAGQFIDPMFTPGFVHNLVTHEISRVTFRAESNRAKI